MLTTTLLLTLLGACAPDRDPVPKILKSVSARRLIEDVEILVGFGTRHSLSDTESDDRGIGAARHWLLEEMEAISSDTGGRLEAREQRFSAVIRGRDVELVNVYGFLPGRSGDPQARTYVVSGHYDSRVSNAMDATSDAPGADDDASGTAVVLELARVLSPHEFDANLVFLCADGEELGLFGSKHFSKWAAEEGMHIDGMITNDIVGGIEGGNGIVDELTVRCFSSAENGLHSPSRELARALVDSAERYVKDGRIQLVFRMDRFGRGGDHIPFDQAGVPALRLTEANEHYARQHQDVRQENGVQYGDLLEFVSAKYMARVARVNAACLAELALAPPPPQAPSMRAAMRYDTQLSWAAVEGAAGYEVVWRETTEARWQGFLAVGSQAAADRTPSGKRGTVRAVVPGISADGHFFGVRTVAEGGHRSRAATPTRP